MSSLQLIVRPKTIIDIDEDEFKESQDPSVSPKLRRTTSRAFLSEDGKPQPVEFFVSSDPAAIVEHTKRVLYLEDDDISHISSGGLVFFQYPRIAYSSSETKRRDVFNPSHSHLGT